MARINNRVSSNSAISYNTHALKAISMRDVIKDYQGLEMNWGDKINCIHHEDTNPSMELNEKHNNFKCWPCNKSFDTIAIVMYMEEISFQEACKSLSEKYGIGDINININEEREFLSDYYDDRGNAIRGLINSCLRTMYQESKMKNANQQYHELITLFYKNGDWKKEWTDKAEKKSKSFRSCLDDFDDFWKKTYDHPYFKKGTVKTNRQLFAIHIHNVRINPKPDHLDGNYVISYREYLTQEKKVKLSDEQWYKVLHTSSYND